MAKQTQKTIDARIAQLRKINFSDDEMNQPDIVDIVANTPAAKWDAVLKELEGKKNGSGESVETVNKVEPVVVNHDDEVEKIANAEIVKLDTNKQKIAELKEKYSNLKITGITDKEGLKAVKEAKSIIRTARTTVEKKRKELKADYITIGKKIDNAAGEYTDLLLEIEGPLDKQLEQYDAWFEEEKNRKEKEENARLDTRVALLKDAGMSFNGSYYVIGETMSMDVVTIKGWTDFDFEAFIAKVRIEKKKIDDAAEQQRIAQEEENKVNDRIASLVKNGIMFNGSEYVIGDKLKATRENIKAMDDVAFDGFANDVKLEKQRLIDEQQKFENEKRELEQEKENMRKEKMQVRESRAHSIGLTFNPSSLSYVFVNKYVSHSITKEMIETLDNATWENLLKETHASIENAKAKENEEKEKRQKWEQMVNSRIGDLNSLGMTKSGRTFIFAGAASLSVDVVDNVDTDWPKEVAKLEEAITAYKQMELLAKEMFEQRSYELTSVGLGVLNGVFIRKNEFGDKFSVSVEEVKSVDADNWSSKLLEIDAAVKELNALTDTKRQALEEEKRKAVPEAAQIHEYLHYIMGVSVPQITNGKLKEILDSFGTGLTNLVDVANSEIDDLNIQ